MIHHIDRIKEKKNHDHVIAAEEASDKIQHPFRLKSWQLEIEENFLNLIKAICEKTDS